MNKILARDIDNFPLVRTICDLTIDHIPPIRKTLYDIARFETLLTTGELEKKYKLLGWPTDIDRWLYWALYSKITMLFGTIDSANTYIAEYWTPST